MQVSLFDGGLNTRVAPSLIAENEAIVYNNINSTSKKLVNVMEPKVLTSPSNISGYFYNFKDTWLSSASPRSYVEYKDILYFTEDGKIPSKFNGQQTSRMGIIGPTGKLTCAEQDVLTAPVSAPTTAQADPEPGDTGISDDAETLVYCYTYYDSVQGRESGPSANATGLNLAANKDALITDLLASVETGVDKIRIYRTGDGISTMTLVMEVPNTTDDRTDNIRTANLSGQIIKAEVGISGDGETLTYTYTYYNSDDGVESIPASISAEITIAANHEVLLQGFVPSEDPQVNSYRIYRIGDGVTEFTLVREIPSTSTFFIDGIDTQELPAPLLDSFDNNPPPENGKFITEAYGIMFMAVGDKLRYSRVGKPDYFPLANEIDFANTITGIFPVPNGLLVFSRTKTDILAGNNASNFAVLPISTEHGSVSHYSGRLVKNIPTWVALDGIANYVGGVVRIVSKDKLGKISLNVINSAVYDEEYYLVLADGSIFVMDTRFIIIFKTYKFTNKIDNILTFNDILYARQGDKLVTMFNGPVAAPFDYTSPLFTEGLHSTSKLYNVIYLRADSEHEFGIEVRVFVDSKEVLYKNFKGMDMIHEIKVPQQQQRGTALQLSLRGIGTVHEIEYKVQGRQNGR